MIKYIETQDKKTGKITIVEWINYSFQNNPYKRLKKGYKIIGIHATYRHAMIKGLINQNLTKKL